MADAENKAKEAPKAADSDKDKAKGQEPGKEAGKGEKAQAAGAKKTGMLMWIIMAVIVIVLAGSGFVLGRIFAGSSAPKTAEVSANEEKAAAGEKKEEKKEGKKEEKKEEKKGEKKGAAEAVSADGTWYYNDLESVVVNPDEPGATRYVRVGLTLEFGTGIDPAEAKATIVSKKPLLINWLNLYFKSLTLAQMQNDRDMKRMLSQICDSFNEILFPDAKPSIKKILIREFNIQ